MLIKNLRLNKYLWLIGTGMLDDDGVRDLKLIRVTVKINMVTD